jgi:hypothetical protein
MDIDGSAQAERQRESLSAFAVKSFVFSAIFSAVLAVGLSVGLNLALPDVYSVERLLTRLRQQMESELGTDRNRIRLVGFLTHNPYVHYKVSLLEEQKGNLEAAVEEIEMALGLFDMGPPNNPARERYAKRLNELRLKQTAAAGKSPR